MPRYTREYRSREEQLFHETFDHQRLAREFHKIYKQSQRALEELRKCMDAENTGLRLIAASKAMTNVDALSQLAFEYRNILDRGDYY